MTSFPRICPAVRIEDADFDDEPTPVAPRRLSPPPDGPPPQIDPADVFLLTRRRGSSGLSLVFDDHEEPGSASGVA